MSKRIVNLTLVRKSEDEVNEISTPPEKTSYDLPQERERVREKFIKLLDEQTLLGSQCEQQLHSKLIHTLKTDFPDKSFRREYLATAYNLLGNLDPEGHVGNSYLRPKLLSGEVTPVELVNMSDEQLYPIKWQQIKDKRLIEIKNKNEMNVATTDLYKCGKCGKRECTYFQLQTRSQDEPMTTFITCVNCDNRWKE